MKPIVIILVLIVLLTGCRQEEISQPQQDSTASSLMWENGEIVELTGTIWPSRADAGYWIRPDDGPGAHLKSKAVDKLEVGTKLWVRGTVEIIHYPKPEGYEHPNGTVRLGVRFPVTFTYINVSDFRILTPQPSQKPNESN